MLPRSPGSTRRFESYAALARAWEGNLDARVDLLRADGGDRLRGALVTPNFFELLGLSAHQGRLFSSKDTEAAPLAILSYDVWRTRFGGDPQ